MATAQGKQGIWFLLYLLYKLSKLCYKISLYASVGNMCCNYRVDEAFINEVN